MPSDSDASVGRPASGLDRDRVGAWRRGLDAPSTHRPSGSSRSPPATGWRSSTSTLGLGAVGLSPLDSGYSLADVHPVRPGDRPLVLRRRSHPCFLRRGTVDVRSPDRLGSARERLLDGASSLSQPVTACALASSIISSSWIEARSGQQQVFSIAILILAAAASVELLTTATPLRALPLIATGTLASIAI